MNVSSIIATLEKGVAFVEGLAPVAQALGVGNATTTKITQAIGAVTEVAQNVQQNVANGVIVANSNDAAQIDALTAKLASANDALMDYVDKS